MYIIKRELLESGDILLTRSSSRESELIRQISKCDYSHAILYVGVSSCIESDGLGVQSQNIQRLIFEKPDDVVVLRLRSDEFKTLIPGAIVFARQKIGTEYSTSEARLSRIEKKMKAKEENRQFCTRFVAQAYEQAGLLIVKNPDYCTPQDILESKLLKPLDDIVKLATEAEVNFAKDKNNPLEIQKEIHNNIFEFARNISNVDIQTFEQLGKFVIENPSKEKEITDFIEKSGYLEMWKMDIDSNPWYYDYKELLKHFKNPVQRKEVGYYFATTERETRERFYMTLETLKYGYSFYNQRFFKIQIDLYNKLIELSEQREFVGILALK